MQPVSRASVKTKSTLSPLKCRDFFATSPQKAYVQNIFAICIVFMQLTKLQFFRQKESTKISLLRRGQDKVYFFIKWNRFFVVVLLLFCKRVQFHFLIYFAIDFFEQNGWLMIFAVYFVLVVAKTWYYVLIFAIKTTVRWEWSAVSFTWCC